MNCRSGLLVPMLAACFAGCVADGPPPVDLSATPVAVPAVAKWNVLRQQLADSQFDALDATLEQYRAASLWDVEKGEQPLMLAYQAFEVASRDVLRQLNRWVKQRPKSWHARTARAFCNLEVGHEVRGSGWGEDLTAQQIHLMTEFHGAAERDARAALELQPRNIGPHYVLLSAAQHRPGIAHEEIQAALAAFPASYALRETIAKSLQPRWGGGKGNYAPIESFVKDSQGHAAANPRLHRLLGMPYWARGRDAQTDGRYEEALGLFNTALAFGESSVFLRDRALAAAAKHDYRTAVADAKRVTELAAPNGEEPGSSVMPTVVQSARLWGTLTLAAGLLGDAIPTLDLVLEQTPDDAFTTTMRAIARCRDDKLPLALKDFERARGLRPTSQESVDRLQSACLASNGKPEEEIKRRQADVLKASGNSQAHYELAGLYSLVGDLPSTIVAYRYACELKHPEACRRIVELQKIADRKGRVTWPAELRSRRALHDQERLPSAADYDAFMAKLAKSSQFTPGGEPARFVHRPFPSFPTWVRGVERGSVDMTIYFNTDGLVVGAKVNSSEPQGYFELAAVTAVLQWRIEPRPTGLKAKQQFDFKIPRDRPTDPYEELLAAARTPAAPPSSSARTAPATRPKTGRSGSG